MTTQAGSGGDPRAPHAVPDGDEPVVRMDAASLHGAAGGPRLVDVSLTLWPGSFRSIAGAPGSGRGLLLDAAAGLRPPAAGRVSLFGQDTAAWSRVERAAAARRIGRVFAEDRLLDHLTVFDNVALPLGILGVGRREIRRRVVDMLDWIGLGAAGAAMPAALSAEARRLAAIARAVVSKPQLVLAHTPLRGLSATSAGNIMFLLEELARHGTAVLVAGDGAGSAVPKAGPALLLRGGRLIEARAAPPPPAAEDGR